MKYICEIYEVPNDDTNPAKLFAGKLKANDLPGLVNELANMTFAEKSNAPRIEVAPKLAIVTHDRPCRDQGCSTPLMVSVQKLEERAETLKEIACVMLATIKCNLERGSIRSDDDTLLKNLCDSWEKQLYMAVGGSNHEM